MRAPRTVQRAPGKKTRARTREPEAHARNGSEQVCARHRRRLRLGHTCFIGRDLSALAVEQDAAAAGSPRPRSRPVLRECVRARAS